MKPNLRRLLINVGMGLGFAVLLAILGGLEFFREMEQRTLDWRFRLRPALKQDSRLVHVDIDNDSIEHYGRWVWGRDRFMDMVNILGDLNVKAVAFDILFAEPSPWEISEERITGLQQTLGKSLDLLKSEMMALSRPEFVKTLEERGNRLLELAGELGWDKDADLARSMKQIGSVYLPFDVRVHSPEAERHVATLDQCRAALVSNPDVDLATLVPPAGISSRTFRDYCIQAKFEQILEKDKTFSFADATEELPEEEVYDPYHRAVRATCEWIAAADLHKAERRILRTMPQSHPLRREMELAINRQKTLDLMKEKAAVTGTAMKAVSATRLNPPLKILAETCKGLGFVNVDPLLDSDGTIRRAPIIMQHDGVYYPNLSLAMVCELLNVPLKNIEALPEAIVLHPAGGREMRIPIDERGMLVVNWAGTFEHTFGKHVPAYEVIELARLRRSMRSKTQALKTNPQDRNVAKLLEYDQKQYDRIEGKLSSLLSDKVCIIGLTATGTQDYKPVPVQAHFPLVGLHTNAINTILQGAFITHPSSGWRLLLLLILGLVLGAGTWRLRPWPGAFFTMGIGILYLLLAYAGFAAKNLAFPVVTPAGTLAGGYLGILVVSFALEERRRRYVQRAFSRYVSPDVMEELLRHPDKLNLTGERRSMTVLFSDIVGFTSYTEQHQPEKVVSMLNEYLDRLTPIIFRHHGTLDKYVGDEILALFGAPQPCSPEEHALNAVLTAIDMVRELKKLQEEWRQRGEQPLDMGIGINTGDMIVGNIGSQQQQVQDYTVIGDAVNLGARLEAATRDKKVHIIISRSTYDLVQGKVNARPLGTVMVKGKEKAIEIFKVEIPDTPNP